MLTKILASLISLVFLLFNSTGISQENEDFYSQGQVDLIGPTGIQIPSGTSSWSIRLSQPLHVNSLNVTFWNTGNCPVAPITSASVKYTNDTYWYSTSIKNGYYYIENRYMVEAIKLDFYLNRIAEFCVVKISGFKDISEPLPPQPPLPPQG